MKKITLLLMALSLSLSAVSIDFNEAKTNPKRINPASQNAVLSYSNVLDEVTKSVVHISTIIHMTNHRRMSPLDDFFGRGRGGDMGALGSGVMVSKDGYIVTNNHVIDGADKIEVTIVGDDKKYKAKIIGADPKSDLAVIKIEGNNFKSIKFASSDTLKVGDVVFAIGNPFGIGQSVTQGIISAQHKSGVGINEYENFIQTDASINPGNSGGALVDSRGALVGINSAILTKSGGNNGIGFAIASNMVRDIASELVASGSIKRGFLGVNISNMSSDMQELYLSQSGALINNVNDGSPAQKGGLKRGDLILKVDGKIVKGANELKNMIGLYTPNSKVKITYERDKKVRVADVVLGSLGYGLGNASDVIEGLELSNIDSTARSMYRIPSSINGALVTKVKVDSKAYDKGVKVGDVIVQVENVLIDKLDTLIQIQKQYKGKKRFYISRHGRIFVVALK